MSAASPSGWAAGVLLVVLGVWLLLQTLVGKLAKRLTSLGSSSSSSGSNPNPQQGSPGTTTPQGTTAPGYGTGPGGSGEGTGSGVVNPPGGIKTTSASASPVITQTSPQLGTVALD